jgi:hypothetical protein
MQIMAFSEAQRTALLAHAERCRGTVSPKRMDLTGQRFGKLTALEFVGKNKLGFTLWRCTCDCGAERTVTLNALRCNRIRACRRCTLLHRQKHDLTGRRFGKLTIVTMVRVGDGLRNKWLCRCDCGRQHLANTYNLISGSTTSCKCARAERGRATRKSMVGLRFGQLVVISPTGKEANGEYIYLCRCDCGKEKAIRGRCLRSGNATTCGCGRIAAILAARALPFGEAAFNYLWYRYQKAASNRNKVWSLTKEQFADLVSKPCFYCGAPPSQQARKDAPLGDFIYNGIDRVDNAIGYATTNCVPCCGICNHAKRTKSLAEFEAWVTAVYRTMMQRSSVAQPRAAV